MKSRIPFLAASAWALFGLCPWGAGASAQGTAAPPAPSALAPLEWISIGMGGGGAVQDIVSAPSLPDRMNVKEDDLDPRWIYAGTLGGGGFLAFDRLPMPKDEGDPVNGYGSN